MYDVLAEISAFQRLKDTPHLLGDSQVTAFFHRDSVNIGNILRLNSIRFGLDVSKVKIFQLQSAIKHIYL